MCQKMSTKLLGFLKAGIIKLELLSRGGNKMNIENLYDRENNNFHFLDAKELKKLSIDELKSYLAELRKYEFANGKELTGIKWRKVTHPIITGIVKADKMFSKEKIVLFDDQHTEDKTNKIYACTHVGGNDIQRTLDILGSKDTWLLLGNPNDLYRNPIYKALELNGVLPLETFDREDRKIAYNRCVELLNKGGNLLIYPEGAWNVEFGKRVNKLFVGVIRMAKETGKQIVPIGLERYDNTYYFNFGKNITIPKDTTLSERELADYLREVFATLKQPIMESQGILERATLDVDAYAKKFISEIVGDNNYFSGDELYQAAKDESFHDKGVVSEEEVFSCLDNVEISSKNAFLVRCRNKK